MKVSKNLVQIIVAIVMIVGIIFILSIISPIVDFSHPKPQPLKVFSLMGCVPVTMNLTQYNTACPFYESLMHVPCYYILGAVCPEITLPGNSPVDFGARAIPKEMVGG